LKIQARTFLPLILICAEGRGQLPPAPQAAPSGPAPVIQQRLSGSAYTGSVPSGTASADTLPLTLRDALQRGLKNNLGILTNQDSVELAAQDRRRTLSALLPGVYGAVTQNSIQSDLAAFGLKVPSIRPVVGPFGVEDARAYAQQTIYDRPALRNLKSATESAKAARLTAEEARNLVVQAVSNAYLAVITDAARADAIQAEVTTAQALLDRAADQKRAGTVAGIDVLRAEVQFRTEKQRLLAQKNQVEKGKLVLARVIGLPPGQKFTLTDSLPFAVLDQTLDELLRQAYDRRPDYKAAKTHVRAAEFALEAARAQFWPSVVVQANYGDIGSTFTASHGTFSMVAGVRFPLYTGGRSQAETDQAQTLLRNRQNAVEEMRGRIDAEVRTAYLDLQSSAEQVEVAKGNADLAGQTLVQAKDRFGAGVTDNIEVIQAQQLQAAANDNYISSLGAHNAAKIALATALGAAEESVPQFLNLKP
jgi:outer membrane protein TolC